MSYHDESIAILFLDRDTPEAFDKRWMVLTIQLRRTLDWVSRRAMFS